MAAAPIPAATRAPPLAPRPSRNSWPHWCLRRPRPRRCAPPPQPWAPNRARKILWIRCSCSTNRSPRCRTPTHPRSFTHDCRLPTEVPLPLARWNQWLVQSLPHFWKQPLTGAAHLLRRTWNSSRVPQRFEQANPHNCLEWRCSCAWSSAMTYQPMIPPRLFVYRIYWTNPESLAWIAAALRARWNDIGHASPASSPRGVWN